MVQPTRLEPGRAQGTSGPLSTRPDSLTGPDPARCGWQSLVALAEVCRFSLCDVASR